ncbi:MAG TPA: choice-of-anchor D domain-containing protein [Candidatus Binataceae bacterium]|nr:choice-of-anchor D domain-containing protein [Candidatus Binataceae bacterium]
MPTETLTATMTATPIATPVNTRLLAAPLRLNFRNVVVADAGAVSAPLTIRLVSRGKTPVMFAQNSPTMAGANPTDFQIAPGSSTCSGSVLNCSIEITFQPTALGSRTAVLRFDDDASNSPQMVTLSGNGSPVKLIMPKAVAFGRVPAGSAISKDIALTNNSDVSVTVTNIASSNPENFPIEQNECATIAPHGSCQLSLGFHPAMIGPIPPAKLEITDDAAHSPQIVRLVGTGSH